MVALRTSLLLVMGFLFTVVSMALLARVREAKGSLRFAKACVVFAAISSAATFITEAVSALNYQDVLLVKQLYVVQDLFAMLVVAFLASFAVLATHAGPRRNLLVALFFLISLIPPAYLAISYNEGYIRQILEPEVLDFVAPPLTYVLYACFGVPIALVPVAVFVKSFLELRKRGDKVLSNRAAAMSLAVALNLAIYAIYVFGTTFVELLALILWIPTALFLMYAVIKITSPIGPKLATATH